MTLDDRIEQAGMDEANRRLIASNSCACANCVTSHARHMSRAKGG